MMIPIPHPTKGNWNMMLSKLKTKLTTYMIMAGHRQQLHRPATTSKGGKNK